MNSIYFYGWNLFRLSTVNHFTNTSGVPTMEKAVMDGSTTFVSYIFDRGTKTERKTWVSELLPVAAKHGHEPIAEMFINRKACLEMRHEGKTAMHWACEKNLPKIIKFLIERDADLNATDNEGRTALHIASSQGYLEAVELLIKGKVNPEVWAKNGLTPLHLAASHGHSKVAQVLLRKQNSEKIQSEIDRTTRRGQTALHIAATKGHFEIVKVLLDYGARVNEKWNWRTALYLASERGHFETVKVLVEKGGADVNVSFRTPSGFWTPIKIAVRYGHAYVVKYLVANGADVTYNTVERAVHHPEILEFFEKECPIFASRVRRFSGLLKLFY